MSCITNILLALVFLVLYASWRLFKTFIFRPLLGRFIDFKWYGSWAVVTGCTDGIGKEYARQLAKKGLNIVLISRSIDKLKDIAKEIESEFHVETSVVVADFCQGSDIYDDIAERLQELDIGVLVNNVGISYPYPEFFADITNKQIQDLIHVNCFSTTFMSHIVLPGMIANKKGIIINLSSIAGITTTPLLTVYSATKGYIEMFSRSLRAECASKGIIVQCVSPFFVSTKMSGIRRSSFIVPTPENYVHSALATVGVQEHSFGCLSHTIQGMIVSSLPHRLYAKLSMSALLKTRAKMLSKQQKQQ